MATKTKEQILNQAISDFDNIEAAIEESGVDVPYDTDTSEYGNLIRLAVAKSRTPQVGDDTSIIIEDNVIKIIGFEAAEAGAQPRKNAEGIIEWVVPSDESVDGLQAIVAGVQSDIVTLQTDFATLEALVSGKVDAVEGSRLITEKEAAKIESVEDGAQANIIEIIKINGVPLVVLGKAVDIPVATNETLGVVKSSTGENKVIVGENGEMSVTSVNINTLVQTEGDELVLCGGSSK